MEQNKSSLRPKKWMGVRNWLSNKSNWKGWGVSSSHVDSSEKNEEEDASGIVSDDATRVFLQELQEIASQLKEIKDKKAGRE